MELRFWKRLRRKEISGPTIARSNRQDLALAGRFFTLLRKFRILILSD